MPEPDPLNHRRLRASGVAQASPEGQPPHLQEHLLPSGAVMWIVVFAAVLGHLPALASYFTQDDWSFLAKGAGIVTVEGWPARIVSNLLFWKLTWPLFGLNAAPYHGTALLLSAGLALMTVRLGLRLGLPPLSAGIAGLVTAGTPVVVTPIFWISATGELLAALFALVALELWLTPGRLTSLGTLLAGLLAAFSKESALALPLLLLLARAMRPAVRKEQRSPASDLAVIALLLLGSGLAGLTVWRAIPHGASMPYEVSGVGTALHNLPLLGVWLVNPWSFPSGLEAGARGVGAVLWLAWGGLALWQWRRGRWLPLFAWILALASLLPVLPLKHHLRPYYLVLAVPAWGWALGAWLGRPLTRWSESVAMPRRAPSAIWLVAAAAVATATVAFSATRSRLTERDANAFLVDPLASRMAVSARAARLVTRLRLPPKGTVAVLQATRTELPAELEPPTGMDLIAVSPLHNALAGERGLQLLVPDDVDVQWVSHLDGLDHDDTVLLDAGDDDFRVLGPARNARLYSALIAISAGQYARGRHDLWAVIGAEGATVEFAYDSDNLPIHPGDLDANAPGFVEYLLEDPSPSSGRILKLFEHLYAAVQGKALFAPLGEEPRR